MRAVPGVKSARKGGGPHMQAAKPAKEVSEFDAHVRPDYVVVVDLNRKYTEVSEGFCKLLGYTREDLIGRRVESVTPLGTNDVRIVFELFQRLGYMQGFWFFENRSGTLIIVRSEGWLRGDRQFDCKMEMRGAGG